MRIVIETIPHEQQRYNTCGDWQWNDSGDVLTIKVSKIREPLTTGSDLITPLFAEMIIGIHELVEALGCSKYGITQKQVDDFDNDKELLGECRDLGIEPGDHPLSPYKMQHLFATGIEKLLCVLYGVPWFQYESALIQMTKDYDANSRTKTE